jgi:hypothetical protein
MKRNENKKEKMKINENKWKNENKKAPGNELNHEWKQINTQRMIKICEHWRPPHSKHELGSGDWVETPTKNAKPFQTVQHEPLINMWKRHKP